MTRDEATKMTQFKNRCTCGGSATTISNDRPVSQPHMSWCPQYQEYADYRKALNIPSNAVNADFWDTNVFKGVTRHVNRRNHGRTGPSRDQ